MILCVRLSLGTNFLTNSNFNIIMKNIFFVAIALLGLSSCSKEDQSIIEPASYKVEISHTGDVSAFDEFINVTIFAKNPNEVTLKGTSLNKGQGAGEFITYTLTGTAQNRSFETSNNVETILVSDIFSKSGEGGKISSTVAIYKNGSLVKKKSLDYDGTGNNILNIGSDE